MRATWRATIADHGTSKALPSKPTRIPNLTHGSLGPNSAINWAPDNWGDGGGMKCDKGMSPTKNSTPNPIPQPQSAS
ncbi:hypothetical protein Mkiyose1665_01450 [Mycobacterium kiyosense]|nr:hypothetical protein IWGMT90018_46110 [Mycobacterium kiyosense]GLC99394.1 hypothetical protein Mkiyose1088_12610 [Mycobacterium kiyosense]GLD16288.1 hypothetical protein Mkiyose1385_03870 [Mycobacterium kiyosense]GLD39645.1 hypothetical protein Mkiyose1665_01450 [Mycobacterium kiyosense]